MFSRCHDFARSWGETAIIAVLAIALAAPVARLNVAENNTATTRVLRVAADPNNLPFSNERDEGFENRIIALLARDLGAACRRSATTLQTRHRHSPSRAAAS